MPRSEALKQAQKRYREKNKAKIQAQQTEYLRQWRKDPKNAEKVREYQRNYQQSDAWFKKILLKKFVLRNFIIFTLSAVNKYYTI